jgi:tetratricopeptide (TPR) repeat protein
MQNKKTILAIVLTLIAIPLGWRAYQETRAYNQAMEHYRLGDNYLTNGGSGAAETELQQAVDMYPDLQPAWSELADAQVEQRKLDEAMKTCDAGLQRFPKNGDLFKTKAAIFRHRGDHANEIANLELAAKADPDDPIIPKLLSRAHNPTSPSPTPKGTPTPPLGTPTPK